jgi:hypothetical protein
MDVIKKSISGLFVFIALAVCGNCFAQKKPAVSGNHGVQFYFDKPITLDSLTKYVHNRSKIRFSFNSSKVKGNKMIYLKKGTYSIDLLLQEIQKNTSLYYSMYNGYVIFQDNPPKQKTKPPAAVDKNRLKPPVLHDQVLSHRKQVAGSGKENNNVQPAKSAGRNPATNDSSEKTNIAPGQPDPVPPIQATVIDSGVRIPVPDSSQQAKSNKPINDRIALATGTKKLREPVNGVQNKKAHSGGEKTDRKLKLQYGLQWNASLPLYGFKNYFTGANNRSQPYNLLIPGVWLSNRFNDKHELLLMVKPGGWYFYNNKEFRSDTGLNVGLPDTMKIRRSSKLLKTGDIYAGLQYNYHISENWMVGGGIGYHRRGRALILQQKKRTTDGVQLPDSLYSIRNDTLANKYLAPGFITGKLEVAYHFGAVDIGASMLMPITNPFTRKSTNQSRPLNWQIFVRWRIRRTEVE